VVQKFAIDIIIFAKKIKFGAEYISVNFGSAGKVALAEISIVAVS
jgi:hypothetical protein